MSTRRIVGIVTGIAGVVISVGHILLAFFTRIPERYHGHEGIVIFGFALAVIGLLLLSGGNRNDSE